ncbi:MAG: hypothetical protein PHW82_10065 [Bacteroidales bacterium]|nr:hypothetical protein [Bacteroidales bacterium]
MKIINLKYFLCILIVVICCIAKGQSIEISGLFNTTEIDDFKNSFGYSLGFGLKNDKHKQISFLFSHCIKDAYYDDIRVDESSNGPQYPTYYFYKINSQNQLFGLHLNFCYYWIENEKSNLGIGSSLSYYYFHYNQKKELTYYRPFPESFITHSVSESVYNRKNRIGLNVFVEFGIKSIFIKNLNLFSRINMGLLTYGPFEKRLGVWDYPWLTKWMTINLGLKYNIKL